MTTTLNSIKSLPGADPCKEGNRETVGAGLDAQGLSLPPSHLALLSEVNGIAVHNGYYRLFGIGCGRCIDLIEWNDFDAWKFAWNKDLSRFLCFGETAWGDQYAYDREAGDFKVYFLDALRMEPEVIAENFDSFLADEFHRCAVRPYDSVLLKVSQRVGPLNWHEHITYIPSPLLGGTEAPENAVKLNARASMIANGDLATQCGHATWEQEVASVENYVDSKGRLRLKVNWAS